ncbi:MAG TPA: TonB family protein [Rhodocyclaceae bacterium]|nr:TonB family protein [Rhodocyclaceae bacterium]
MLWREKQSVPALARERGWEGRVEVRIGVVPGQRPVVGLLRSSGHDMLDEQALAMVGKALPAVALPDTLRGHSFSVPVPVEFFLRDD